ncbi:DUF3800 domain-containing protein [Candidatus Endomicrobiellum trichonymphae]|uniref:DUF3800-domain protein n=1 Tax=Endomicrobium trichonymphae TaxID=1408204 RepID=B1GZJ5_ENDTX|nr:DUF3800 domain-containing protein [Candidatus Endomicrobium trichonymphae]BAG13677.1 DUF3800-domain protein [Candidatus Endomicrobium trichonymphae]
MAYIFMDESGCLGFDFTKAKTSRYFVIAFLMAKNDNVINKAVSKIFKSIPKNELRVHCGTLHCYKENDRTRIKLLTELKGLEDKDVSVMSIILNKKKVVDYLQSEKTRLYNYITKILLDRIINKRLLLSDESIDFIASRREKNRFLNENFRNYLKTKAFPNHKLKIEVSITPPHSVKGLQAVDFVSWAVFKKYEHAKSHYYNIIENLVVEESPLF